MVDTVTHSVTEAALRGMTTVQGCTRMHLKLHRPVLGLAFRVTTFMA